MYVSGIIFIALIVADIITWKKYNDRRYFWYLFPMSGLLIITVLKHLSETYLQLSGDQRAIEFFIFAGLSAVAVVALLVITLKRFDK
jgi:DMSO reductase anchor subunit